MEIDTKNTEGDFVQVKSRKRKAKDPTEKLISKTKRPSFPPIACNDLVSQFVHICYPHFLGESLSFMVFAFVIYLYTL